MVVLPPDVQTRRNVEDRAIQLGEERAELDAQLSRNTLKIKALTGEAEAANMPLETFAKLVGVSRQTLYTWRDAKAPSDWPASPTVL